MSDTTQTNAMAEIALALAMGFFSIMVLTMVSMGSGMVSSAEATKSAIEENPIQIAKTAPKDSPTTEETGKQTQVKSEELIVFYNGQYLDHSLKAVSPTTLQGRDKVVLAVSPDLSMSQTMTARNELSVGDITVVMLDQNWLTRLQEMGR